MVFPMPLPNIPANSFNGTPVPIPRKTLAESRTRKGCSLKRVVPRTIQKIARHKIRKEKLILICCLGKIEKYVQ